jgi:hypothetical protein
MKLPLAILTRAVVIIGGLGLATSAAAQAPTYTNAEVVSIDPQSRTLVIKAKNGAEQTVELDDMLGGVGDVAPGDEVIVALRAEPGRNRVSAIRKSTVPQNDVAVEDVKVTARTTSPTRTRPPVVTDRDPSFAFSERVAALSAQASRIDSLWSSFRATCGVTLNQPYDGAREWFSLWDQVVRADYTSGFCRDLFNRIVGEGEAIKQAMGAAEDDARQELLPGAIREVRRRYSMDWDGWDRPAPEPLAL